MDYLVSRLTTWSAGWLRCSSLCWRRQQPPHRAIKDTSPQCCADMASRARAATSHQGLTRLSQADPGDAQGSWLGGLTGLEVPDNSMNMHILDSPLT